MVSNKRITAYNVSGLELPPDASILSLSPFPPNGEWGGAIRSNEINKLIKSIYPNSKVLHMFQMPTRLGPIPDFLDNEHPQLTDIKMLYQIFPTENYLDHIPDAIIFDHPWLWFEAKRLKELFPNTKLIHSSHNLEFTLKRELLKGLEPSHIDSIVDFLEDIEFEIANKCDLIICVKESEAEWFKSFGAENVVVANNGTNTNVSSVKSPKKYVLVVGSGHPPNVEGSIKYLYDATNWLPIDTDLIFVGSMCNGLKGRLGKERNDFGNSTIRFLGVRNNEELAKLIESASVIALPIPYGGGSNLKTAEALCSGRPIVSTEIAFRGFEEFKYSENVQITDDIRQFQKSIVWYCGGDKEETVRRKNIENLSWTNTLFPIEKYLLGM